MIFKGSDTISNIYKGLDKIASIYKGTQLLYQSNKLPSGYTKLKYLENDSDGKAYIDTRVDFQDLIVNCTQSFTQNARQLQGFGVAAGQFWGITDDTHLELGTASATQILVDSTQQKLDTVTTFQDGVTTLTYKNESVTRNIVNTPTKTLTLFLSSTSSSYPFKSGRNYNATIKTIDNKVIRNFVPCISPNGTYGMYDLANSGKNLFNKFETEVLKIYISGSNGVTKLFTGSTGLRSVIVPCKPNTDYVVSKQAGLAFRIFSSEEYPTINVSGYVINASRNTVSSIAFTTNENANYLTIVFYTYNSTETITEDEMLNTLQVEEGTVATQYEPHPFYGNANTTGSFTGA